MYVMLTFESMSKDVMDHIQFYKQAACIDWILGPIGPGAQVQAATGLAWKLLSAVTVSPLLDESCCSTFCSDVHTHTTNVSVRCPHVLLCLMCKAQTSTKGASAAGFQQQPCHIMAYHNLRLALTCAF